MFKNDVLKNLSEIVKNVSDEEVLVTRKGRFVKVDDFVAMFKESDITYKSLIEHSTKEGGWHEVFDEWKEKGILN